MGVTLIGSTVNAQYVVYKTKNVVNQYTKAAVGGTEWLPDANTPKLTVETYTVFNTIAGKLNTDVVAPQKIVIFKPAKGETATVTVDGKVKKVTKLMIDPTITLPTQGYLAPAISAKYIPYSTVAAYHITCPWKVLNSNGADKKAMSFIYDYSVEAAGQDLAKSGENYGGKVSVFTAGAINLTAAKSFAGTFSYVEGLNLAATNVGQDAKGSLKFDKATTQAAVGADITAATKAVVAYLAGKGYVATWNQ